MKYGWSLKKSDWARLPTELLSAQKWRGVPLFELEVNSVPKKSGVYMICATPLSKTALPEPNTKDVYSKLFAPVYIGSGNLQQRFKKHTSQNPDSEGVRESRECFGTNLEFWFHQVDPEYLKSVEQKLLSCFGPRGNKIRSDSDVGASFGKPIPA